MSHKRTIYVGGIDDAAAEDTLIQAFSTFGEVSDVQIPRDGPGTLCANRPPWLRVRDVLG